MPTRSRLLPLSVALPVVLLTACAPLDDAPTDPPSAGTSPEGTAPDLPVGQAEEITPVVELGEFNAEHDEFVVFDPCTEIPREVLDEAGLGEMVSEPFYSPLKSVMCTFSAGVGITDLELVTLAGDAVPKERVIDQGFMIAEPAPSVIDDVYVHHMGEGTEDTCTAAIHTTRGRWTVEYTAGFEVPEQEVLCSRAIDYLETIYFQMGERNGSST